MYFIEILLVYIYLIFVEKDDDKDDDNIMVNAKLLNQKVNKTLAKYRINSI